MSLSPTRRSTPTRLRERARTDRSELYAVLDAGLVCHVGVVRDGAPVVLPTGYGRIDETVYIHGSTGAGWLRIADGAPVCLTVTHLDGVVYARSVFHFSMNYRSAVVHSGPHRHRPDERQAALRAIVEQLAPAPGSTPACPTPELAATTVVALDLTEASVKVHRSAGDEPADIVAGGRWAVCCPSTALGEPEPDPTLEDALTAPDTSGRVRYGRVRRHLTG